MVKVFQNEARLASMTLLWKWHRIWRQMLILSNRISQKNKGSNCSLTGFLTPPPIFSLSLSFSKKKKKKKHGKECRSRLLKCHLFHKMTSFNDPEIEEYWKHRGKRKNVGNQNFYLFPLFQKDGKKHHLSRIKYFVCNDLQLDPVEIVSFGKGILSNTLNYPLCYASLGSYRL